MANGVVMVGHVATPTAVPWAMDSTVDCDSVVAIEHFASVVVAWTSIVASADPLHFDFVIVPTKHRLACYSISCPATLRTVADRNRLRRLGNRRRQFPFVGHAFVAAVDKAVDSFAVAYASFDGRSDSTGEFLVDCAETFLVG